MPMRACVRVLAGTVMVTSGREALTGRRSRPSNVLPLAEDS